MANLLSKFRMKKTGTEIEIADASARSENAEQSELIAANTLAINQENEDRINGDNALSNAVSVVSEQITTETDARISADNSLNQKITDNETAITAKADKTDVVTNVVMTAGADEYILDKVIGDSVQSNVGYLPIPVTDITITNENGIYTLSKTKNGETTEIGTIETSKSNNPVVEVKDSIVENSTNGYDFHTLQETTEDGTENDIAKFYIARTQLTGVSIMGDDITFTNVSQSGTEGTQILSPNYTEQTYILDVSTLSNGMFMVSFVLALSKSSDGTTEAVPISTVGYYYGNNAISYIAPVNYNGVILNTLQSTPIELQTDTPHFKLTFRYDNRYTGLNVVEAKLHQTK